MGTIGAFGFFTVITVALLIPLRFRCIGRIARAGYCTVMVGWPYGLVNFVMHFTNTEVRVGVGGKKHRLTVRLSAWRGRGRGRKPRPREGRGPGKPAAARRRISRRAWKVMIEGLSVTAGEMKRLIRRAVRLQRLAFDGEFGDRNPAVTGMVYGGSRAMDHATARWLTIRLLPNFQAPGITGTFEITGTIAVYPLVRFPFSLVLGLVSRLTLRRIRETVRELKGRRRARAASRT